MQFSLFSEIEIETSGPDNFSSLVICQELRILFNLSQPASEAGLSLLIRTALTFLSELGTLDPLPKQGGKERHTHSKWTLLFICKK